MVEIKRFRLLTGVEILEWAIVIITKMTKEWIQMPNYASALKTYRCSNCGDEYQSLSPYLHPVLWTVCVYCLDIPVTESKWA